MVIIPVDDLSNAVCEAAAATIPDVLALPHHYGRLQFGEDLELTFRTLIGTGANPNVAAAVVVGIEPNWTARVADGIAASGKPVDGSGSRATGTCAPTSGPRGGWPSSSATPASASASRPSPARS